METGLCVRAGIWVSTTFCHLSWFHNNVLVSQTVEKPLNGSSTKINKKINITLLCTRYHIKHTFVVFVKLQSFSKYKPIALPLPLDPWTFNVRARGDLMHCTDLVPRSHFTVAENKGNVESRDEIHKSRDQTRPSQLVSQSRKSRTRWPVRDFSVYSFGSCYLRQILMLFILVQFSGASIRMIILPCLNQIQPCLHNAMQHMTSWWIPIPLTSRN